MVTIMFDEDDYKKEKTILAPNGTGAGTNPLT